ncbi:hypothetical protein ScPMuIL_014600 [Solemya velum]
MSCLQEPTTPHPPPLPPLPPPPLPKVCVSIKTPDLQKKSRKEDDIAAYLRVGRKALSFLKRQENEKDSAGKEQWFLSAYKEVIPVIQDGPQCGFVALQMVHSLMRGHKTSAVEAMIDWAVSKGFTKHGEMLSVNYMKSTAEDYCGLDCSVLHLEEKNGRSVMLNYLLQGLNLVIVYDDDKNHTPCLKDGHKAHWAVLTGFFLVLNTNPSTCLKNLEHDSEHGFLYHCHASEDVADNLAKILSLDSVYVYGHHGKSRYAGIWRLDELFASNANLTAVDPSKDCDYVIPEEGIAKTLRCRALVIGKSTS